MTYIAELVRRVFRLVAALRSLSALSAINPHLHPASIRKPPLRIFLDLAYQLLRWDEPATLYFAQRLDLESRRVRRDYLSYARFRQLRDQKNATHGSQSELNYACLLRDKLLFERYYSSGGFPVPKSLGVLASLESPGLRSLQLADLYKLAAEEPSGVTLFVKPRYGIKGKNAFKLHIADESLYLNDREISAAEFQCRVQSQCLVQRYINQNAAFSELYPGSLNTLRIVTFRNAIGISAPLVYLRLGANGSTTDNDNGSRVVVNVDLESRTLCSSGYMMNGDDIRSTLEHPTSRTRFGGFAVPFLEESIELARAAHAWTPLLTSIGWDIALTADGPLLLEGNDDWGATLAMWINPTFKEIFLDHSG